jgi:uncharacterized protein YkwD
MHRFSPALALALLTLAVIPPAIASAADPVLDVEEKAFCKQINQYRAQNGLPALRASVSLTNASKWMSNDMATMNYFSHTDSLGRTFSTRLGALGYAYGTPKAENIAAGNSTAAGTFAQWKASSGHNTNMLSSSYKVIGIGRAYNSASTYKWYWTTDFGAYVDRTIPC